MEEEINLDEYADELIPPEPGSFYFRHASELTNKPKPVHWLIKHYLEAGSLWQIFGASESCKTFVVLDMAFCYAAGIPWFGNLVKHPGKVFYICGEGAEGLGRRLKALEIHHNIKIKDIPFFVSSRAASFLDKGGAFEVVMGIDRLVERYGTPDLIILDTLSRNFGCGDENSAQDMTQFVSIIDSNLRDKYKSSVGIVHHTGLMANDRGRGSSALRGALDFEYSLTVNPNESRTMKCTKSKDFEAAPNISFEKKSIDIPDWLDEDTGCPLSSLVMIKTTDTGTKGVLAKLKGQKAIAFKALQDCLIEKGRFPGKKFDGNMLKIDVETWRKMAFRMSISDKSDDAKRIAFNRAVDDLLNLNIVEGLDDFYWPK